MTGSDMNDSVMNGSMPRDTPSSKALLRSLQLVVDLDKAVLAHEACDLQDELTEHGPVLPTVMPPRF